MISREELMKQLRAMPSSLNDACRTMEMAADFISGQQQPVIEDARHEVASWMIGEGYVTGHGDTLDDLMQGTRNASATGDPRGRQSVSKQAQTSSLTKGDM